MSYVTFGSWVGKSYFIKSISIYTILHCKNIFSCVSDLQQKRKKKNQCYICFQKFYSKSHQKRHEKNLEAFVSVFCKNCDNFVGLDESKFHHCYLYFCMACHDYIPTNSYQKHICFHKKVLQRLADKNKVFCKFCKESFFWKNDVDNHEKECGDQNLDSLTCKCCNALFSTMKGLDDHLQFLNEARDKRKFNCIFCHLKLESESAFETHMKTDHSKIVKVPEINKQEEKSQCIKGTNRLMTKIPCRFCNLTFKNKNWVISHERKKHATELIKCDICLENVKMENAKSHYVSHRLHEKYKNTPDKICNICGLRIKNLDNHMVRHEDERRHKCSVCPKTFKLQWDLKRHMLVHSNEAKHICQICGKGFKVGYNLRVHMRSHEVVKPFPCLVCEKTFTTKQWRDNHMKTHDSF